MIYSSRCKFNIQDLYITSNRTNSVTLHVTHVALTPRSPPRHARPRISSLKGTNISTSFLGLPQTLRFAGLDKDEYI